jgi:hypothetical protein
MKNVDSPCSINAKPNYIVSLCVCVCMFFILECSPPQNTSHSFVVNINVSPLLITATYECSPGYWYSNGVFTTTSQCFANGTWSSVPDCAGS